MDGHVSFNRHKGCGFEAILQRKFPGKSLMEYLKPGQLVQRNIIRSVLSLLVMDIVVYHIESLPMVLLRTI